MATETIIAPVLSTSISDFHGIPPFPDDVPTVPLLRLSLKKLYDEDQDESRRLFQVSKDLGFFYLDLRGTPTGHSILQDVDDLFTVGEELFDLDVEEKQKYDFSAQKSYFGYKGYGQAFTDKAGTRDRNEFYNISKDDILSLSSPLPAPTILTHNRPLLTSFISTAHSILALILAHLNTHLHLPNGTLPSLHRLLSPSGDQVRLLKAPPQQAADSRTALGAHTDFGSLTLLFNRVGGLQVLLPPSDSTTMGPHPTSSQWRYVRPLPSHAIVNLGDAMSKFSNGLLRSSMHRVVPPPGKQASVAKYSVVYFSRPEDEVLLRRLDGGDVIPELGEGEGEGEEEVMRSKDWILRKAMGRRVGGNVS